MDYWLGEFLMNSRSLELLLNEFFVLFMDEWLSNIMNDFFVSLMNDWLMNLPDIFCVDNRLMVLMNNVLMLLMNYVFVMFVNDILMMLMNNVFMMFLDNWLVHVTFNLNWQDLLVNLSAFHVSLNKGLVVVSDDCSILLIGSFNNWCTL